MASGRRGTARIAVLTFIADEFDQAQAALGATHHLAHTPYFAPDLATLDVVLMRTSGPGNGASQAAASRMIEDFQPEIVIGVGIAGGVEKDWQPKLGDVVTPTYLHYGDLRKLGPGQDNQIFVPFDQPAGSLIDCYLRPISILDTWRSSIVEPRPDSSTDVPRVREGNLVAGDKLYGDPTHPEQQRLFSHHPDAIAVDMESYGVARAVYESRDGLAYNPRLVIIRGISDTVRRAARHPWYRPSGARRRIEQTNERANQAERDLWRRYAAAAAAALAAQFVSEFLTAPDPRARVPAARGVRLPVAGGGVK